MLKDKERVLNLIKRVAKNLNINTEDMIYIDILILRLKNNKEIPISLFRDIERIDEKYKERSEDNLLIQHYKSFKNICKELSKLVITN